MTENEFSKIIDLHNNLKDLEDKENQIKNVLDFSNLLLFYSLADGVRHYDSELKGESLMFKRITDKIFYENQERIKKVIIDILQEQLEMVVTEKNHIKFLFENIEVGKIADANIPND